MKTIEVDSAALARLKAARQNDETWSDVIKRCVPARRSAQEVLASLRELAQGLSEETLDAIDKSVSRRRRQPRRRKA